MKVFSAAAIIALAASGLAAQNYAEGFQANQPELERLMGSMGYMEVIEKIEAILPPDTPEFAKDPENPNVGMASFYDLDAIQTYHVYLGRAYVMSGGLEKAILNFKKADEIAKLKASEIVEVVGPMLENWKAVVEDSQKQLEGVEVVKKQKADIEKQKADIEAKGKKQTKQDKELLKQVTEVLGKMAESEPMIEQSTPVWKSNIERFPAIEEQLNQIVEVAKSDTTKFSPAIEALEEDLRVETETIESKFAGDKAKYVESVIGTKGNLDSLNSQVDKVKFLNRLLFLAPQNKAVQQQLDSVKGNS